MKKTILIILSVTQIFWGLNIINKRETSKLSFEVSTLRSFSAIFLVVRDNTLLYLKNLIELSGLVNPIKKSTDKTKNNTKNSNTNDERIFYYELFSSAQITKVVRSATTLFSVLDTYFCDRKTTLGSFIYLILFLYLFYLYLLKNTILCPRGSIDNNLIKIGKFKNPNSP